MNKVLKFITVVSLSSGIGISSGFAAAKPKKKYVQPPVPSPSIPWPIACFSLANIHFMDVLPVPAIGSAGLTATYDSQCSFGNSNGGCKISLTSNVWNLDTGEMIYSSCTPRNLDCSSGQKLDIFMATIKAGKGNYLWIFQVWPTECPVSGNYLSSAFLFFTLQ